MNPTLKYCFTSLRKYIDIWSIHHSYTSSTYVLKSNLCPMSLFYVTNLERFKLLQLKFSLILDIWRSFCIVHLWRFWFDREKFARYWSISTWQLTKKQPKVMSYLLVPLLNQNCSINLKSREIRTIFSLSCFFFYLQAEITILGKANWESTQFSDDWEGSSPLSFLARDEDQSQFRERLEDCWHNDCVGTLIHFSWWNKSQSEQSLALESKQRGFAGINAYSSNYYLF